AARPVAEAAQAGAMADASPDPVRAAGAAGARALWTPLRPVQLPSRKRGDFYEVPLSPYLPRVSFFADSRVEPDRVKAMRDAAEGRVDFTREVLLDRAPPSARQEGASRRFLVARIAEDPPERGAIEASLGSPGVLVLADRDYPGWVAEVDGSRAPILLANSTFRAVALPAGSHRVVFRYRPLSVYAGGIVSGVAWIAVLLLWMGGE